MVLLMNAVASAFVRCNSRRRLLSVLHQAEGQFSIAYETIKLRGHMNRRRSLRRNSYWRRRYSIVVGICSQSCWGYWRYNRIQQLSSFLLFRDRFNLLSFKSSEWDIVLCWPSVHRFICTFNVVGVHAELFHTVWRLDHIRERTCYGFDDKWSGPATAVLWLQTAWCCVLKDGYRVTHALFSSRNIFPNLGVLCVTLLIFSHQCVARRCVSLAYGLLHSTSPSCFHLLGCPQQKIC